MAKLPSQTDILNWVRDHPEKASKRDIARAFGIKGAAKTDLKFLLRDMAAQGLLDKRRRKFTDPDGMPPVAVLKVIGLTADGDVLAEPAEWAGDDAPPVVFMLPGKPSDPTLGEGDRVLTKLTKAHGRDFQYTGRVIRKIGTSTQARILGIYRSGSDGGRIVPIDKGSDKEWRVRAGETNDAQDGELVEAERAGPKARMGLSLARITARLGDPSAPKAISLIAIKEHGIPDRFPDDVLAQADAAKPTTAQGRRDLRDLPLITIDPADARDHDDACCAIAHDDGGFTLWVAIADVAHYVRPGSALDTQARLRGNSSYFPDRVVPMLPDQLSGDLCSLHQGVDRPCIAVEMRIDADGNKTDHQFHRGIMNSPAALSYNDAQAAIDGTPNAQTKPLLDPVLRPLFAAYGALKKARDIRQPLNLDLPERRIILSDQGEVTSVAFRDRLDAHKLVEEFMILANVAAAQTLVAHKMPLLFRIHEEPSPEKLDALRDVAKASGLVLAKGQVLHTRHLNQLLDAAAGTDAAELINMSTLRSMTQAYYCPENFAHFGLNLRNYAHFTSPIRRYADLIVHRALITAHGWGDDGLSDTDIEMLDSTAKAISDTERRSMLAERDTTDRYLAAYMEERRGNEFTGRVAGIARFGIFVKLDETGADGLVPMRALGREYFAHDKDNNMLVGSDTGRVITLGQRATVRVAEANGITGGLVFDVLELENTKITPPRGGPRRGGGKRGFGKHGSGKRRNVVRKRK